MKHNLFTLSIIVMSLILMIILFLVIDSNKPVEFVDISEVSMYVELPEFYDFVPETKDYVDYVEEMYKPVIVHYRRMELVSLGKYFITAYCPYECGGSWSTASGATCHRACDNYRLSEPTTCAISRSVHGFGDEFYIKEFDRTFVAEDTGPGVQGRHLDLFYEDYSEVLAFPTGYYEVFAVEWVEETVVVTEEDLKFLKEMGATEYFIEKGD